MGFGGSSGGGGTIAGSGDVALNNPNNSEILSYDSAVSKWKNAPASGSSTWASITNKPAVIAAGATAAAARTAIGAVGSGNATFTSIEYYPDEASLPATGTTGVLYVIPAEG